MIMRKETINFGKDIFLTEESNTNELAEFLKKDNIQISFLFEDGIELSYPENLTPKNYPGTLSFYKGPNIVLTFSDSFGEIIITRVPSGETLNFKIEI